MLAPAQVSTLLVGVLVCVTTRNGFGQAAGTRDTTATVVGTIVDASSGRPVQQARVSVRGTALRTTSDLRGSFELRRVLPGRHTIEARRIGYELLVVDDVSVAAGASTKLTLSMQPTPFRLAEITVVPGSFSLLDAGPASRQTITRADIEAAPFGEDLFRALTRLPGLSSGDYGAHFSIRGGRADETLFLLDGLEIYEPFHLKDFDEGALSIIDVEAIDGVELLTGGFPAQYSDRRSGVMNITSRVPREDGTHVTAGLSFTNTQALGEGTFANRGGSWLVSARHGFVDLALRLINKKETQAPSYEDVFGTVRYKLNANHSLALDVLQAGDRYRFSVNGSTGFNDTIPTRETANNGYGNTYTWLTLRSLIGRQLAATTLVSVGDVNATRRGDETETRFPVELYGVNGERGFSFHAVKQDVRWLQSNRMVLNAGYDLRYLDAHFDWTNRVSQDPDNPTPDTLGFYPRITRRSKSATGRTIGAYLSNRLQVFDPLTLELGVRYDAATYTHDRDWSPRLHALVRLPGNNSLRAGWGQYTQRQGIGDENAFDSLSRYFPSELSRQWTMGLEHRYVDGGSFRAEAYYKTGSRLRPILRNWKGGLNVFPESAEDRIRVWPDSSWSKGVELYHERSIGRRFNLRAGYALAFVREHVTKVEHINDPLTPPFYPTHPGPQDQRHALHADVSYRASSAWTITSAFTFHSGWPYTHEIGVPVRKRNGTMDLAVRPETLYAARLPSYQRIDLRVTRRKVNTNGEFRFFFEVINLTNHENVLAYDVFTVRDAGGPARIQSETETWFSILPSLGVSWSRRF